jgi:hypothetical protein
MANIGNYCHRGDLGKRFGESAGINRLGIENESKRVGSHY